MRNRYKKIYEKIKNKPKSWQKRWKEMNQLKAWPFEPLGDPDVTPCGGGPGGGGFPG